MPRQEPNHFEAFWAAYPRRIAKLAAVKAWAKAVKLEQPAVIIAAVEQHKQCEQWQNPQYIPHPATWLNRGQWADEISSTKALPIGSVQDRLRAAKELLASLPPSFPPNPLSYELGVKSGKYQSALAQHQARAVDRKRLVAMVAELNRQML